MYVHGLTLLMVLETKLLINYYWYHLRLVFMRGLAQHFI
jgi:hypothetical protein